MSLLSGSRRAQLIVHPNNRGPSVANLVVGEIPRAARVFGFVPDFRACKPGDLILTRNVEPGVICRSISSAQGGFSQEDAQWTHAAVFLIDDLVVEAVPFKGVRTHSLYADIPRKVFRVRRYPSLSDDERFKIALFAQALLGRRYSLPKAFAYGWERQWGIWDPVGASMFGRGIICSKVFYDACLQVTRNALEGCPASGQVVTPAHLSVTPTLQEVAVGWIALS